MFQQVWLYWLAGILLIGAGIFAWRDPRHPRRLATSLFWVLYGLLFFVSDTAGGDGITPRTIHIVVGALVVLLAVLAGCGAVRAGHHHQRSETARRASAQSLGNRLFLPALTIPLVTLAGVLLLDHIPGLQQAVFGAGHHSALVTLFSIAIGCVVALLLALRITRERPTQAMQESRRLLDAIGWAFLLPQTLATLGLLFTKAGVGQEISWLASHYLAVDNRFIAVMLYTVGMAVLTMVMGNAFAAFPIITAGVGLPILITQHGGDPAIMAAIGMFSGYCGTLMTPMAANFNLVPAALLELPQRNAVIRAQIPTAIPLLLCNTLLLYYFMYC